MALSAEAEQRLRELAARMETAMSGDAALAAANIPILGAFLEHSEAKLISLMSGKEPPDSDPGSIEFGMVLYWVDTLPWLEWLHRHLPKTKITQAMLDAWKAKDQGAGVVASDGTLISDPQYAQLDPGWIEAGVFYIALKLGIIHKRDFPKNDSPPARFTGDSLTVAVIGDWGTGPWSDGADAEGPAISIIGQVAAMQPDLTIHLGDVYYAGTDFQEELLFLDVWRAGAQGSFALNSNHEMYPGGTGYFDKTLVDPRFVQQSKASYFAIEFADWVIIGLDSAYDIELGENTMMPFFLDGRITDEDQRKFVADLDLAGKKIMILTHHTGLETDGGKPMKLLQDIQYMLHGNPAFAGQEEKDCNPDYWYWGHVHNGIVYKDSAPGLGDTGIKRAAPAMARSPSAMAMD